MKINITMMSQCVRLGSFSLNSSCVGQTLASRLSVSVCRVAPSCTTCQDQRKHMAAWCKTPLRTFSQGSVARTPLKMGYQSQSSHIISQYHHRIRNTHQFGNYSLLQGKDSSLQYTSKRSLGISISGSENVDGVYIPTPTEKCYELLEYIHDSAGLPWWLTILATTILFKGMIVFPFAVWQQMVLARIENAQPLINAYVEQIKQQLAIIAKDEGWSRRKMGKAFGNEVRLLVSNIHYEQKCSSHKLVYLPIWQAGVWLSMTTAIGQMTGKHPELFSTELDIDVLPALASEGMLWFSDLMQTDITLAILLGLVNITLVELWSLRRGPLTRIQHNLHNVGRGAAILSIPAASLMPAAVSFYWLASSLLGLGQLAVLRVPAVRRLLGIPHTPSEMKRPLEEIKSGLRARYAKKRF